ncbi:MAG: WecB/TagA/CpsF family glycosyltransferase [Candidatus Daviesbacteria bacterium]|nr:WecB/TagA/CpsF family glycosyltransferase [Candidatus Daviesbacteria bacterium]
MEDKLDSVNILGVRVDKVTMDQAVELVGKWIMVGGRHYIVTPNPEFVMLAQKDEVFKNILNKSDLAIPDGSRLGWASSVLQEKNFCKKLLVWLTFLFPPKQLIQFDTVSGVDLMERLCKASVDWARLPSPGGEATGGQGSTIGLLGGKDKVAEQTAECLQKKYPKLKIIFAESGGKIDSDGNVIARIRQLAETKQSDSGSGIASPASPARNDKKVDILFVAFGQGKQEKWIANNLKRLPIKVMMGVGGSFDEILGLAPRPPKWILDLKLKWLFRLVTEPWRIKRQLQLVKFLYLVLTK